MKTELPTDLLSRIRNHQAIMAPHQKERSTGKLLIEAAEELDNAKIIRSKLQEVCEYLAFYGSVGSTPNTSKMLLQEVERVLSSNSKQELRISKNRESFDGLDTSPGSESCQHCGAPRLDQSKEDVISGLWQYDCGTIDGKEKQQSGECVKIESDRFKSALEYIASDVFCFTLEKATQTAKTALNRARNNGSQTHG